MRTYRRLIVLLTALCVVAPVLAESEPAGDELEQNRQKLAGYRADTKRYTQLLADLKTFQALPAERQERIREFDKKLHREKPETRERLLRTAERYSVWLDSLSDPDDRRRIDEAANPKQRLKAIKEIKDIGEQRLPLALREFVRDTLRPLLNGEERKRLDAIEGQWPQYARVVVELADKHPVALPGPITGPKRYPDLPEDVRAALGPQTKSFRSMTQPHNGKYPDYCLAVAAYAKSKAIKLPAQLGPSRPVEFTAAVQKFIKEKLTPKLSDEEKKRLDAAEGSWPDYPRTLLELADKHGLPVPGMVLPGPKEFWDSMRNAPLEKPTRPVIKIGPGEDD